MNIVIILLRRKKEERHNAKYMTCYGLQDYYYQRDYEKVSPLHKLTDKALS